MEFPGFRIDDAVAIITGSGSGIGQASAWALARAGASVVVTELPGRLDRAEATAREITAETGQSALALPLDVTKTDTIFALVNRVVDELGRVDVLVNSAGTNRVRAALAVSEDDWDSILNVNLKGLFFCCQAAGRQMLRQGHGKIINLASINGMVGYPKLAPYCASKGAIVNLTKALAVEWAPLKINVNAVGPTYIETAMNAAMLSYEPTRNDILARSPQGHLGKVEDVAGAIVFLASPAADAITGHTLLVDGGWTAW